MCLLDFIQSSEGEVTQEFVDNDEASNLNVLLHYACCDKLALRCIEQELHPNWIYCLRFMQLLELRLAHEDEDSLQRTSHYLVAR